MALIDMCFSKIVNGEIKRIKFSIKKDDTNGLYIGVSSDYSVNLDMMSFAVKAIEYKECQEALINNIKEVLIEILKHVNFNSIDIKTLDIEGFIKEKLPFRYVNKKIKIYISHFMIWIYHIMCLSVLEMNLKIRRTLHRI